jgi:hypothetical protein
MQVQSSTSCFNTQKNNELKIRNLTWQQFILIALQLTCLAPHMVIIKCKLITSNPLSMGLTFLLWCS